MQGEIDEEDASIQLLEMQMDPDRVYQTSLTGLLGEDQLPRSLTGAYEDDPLHSIDKAGALQMQRRQHLRDFKYRFENAQDPATGLTREILCDMYRLKLRRPLISDHGLRSYLVSIGIDKDCENSVRDRPDCPRSTQRHETRKHPSGVHVSTEYARILLRGYDYSAWNASNSENPFVIPRKHPPRPASVQRPTQCMENNKLEPMELESVEDMANAVILYRRQEYTIGKTLDVIKGHLAVLKFDVNEYLQEIDDPNSDVDSLAMCMLKKNAVEDGPSDGDDDHHHHEDESSDGDSSNDSQSEYLVNKKLEKQGQQSQRGR